VGAVNPGAEVVGVEDDHWGGHCSRSGCGREDRPSKTEEGSRTWVIWCYIEVGFLSCGHCKAPVRMITYWVPPLCGESRLYHRLLRLAC
jgi:hypothetical protein